MLPLGIPGNVLSGIVPGCDFTSPARIHQPSTSPPYPSTIFCSLPVIWLHLWAEKAATPLIVVLECTQLTGMVPERSIYKNIHFHLWTSAYTQLLHGTPNRHCSPTAGLLHAFALFIYLFISFTRWQYTIKRTMKNTQRKKETYKGPKMTLLHWLGASPLQQCTH